jgi:hypothetical protein
MKTALNLGIAGLLIFLLGFILIKRASADRSTTFAGPEFHSYNVDDTRAVCSKLSDHLIAIGFHQSSSPSPEDSWAGLHTDGGHRIWFEKNNGRRDTIFVYIDQDQIAVRTSVKWRVKGSQRRANAAEKHAYSLASDLQRWFDELKEHNELPLKFREQKRLDFTIRSGDQPTS